MHLMMHIMLKRGIRGYSLLIAMTYIGEEQLISATCISNNVVWSGVEVELTLS